MSVYLGSFGKITLQRTATAGDLASVINPSDINTSRRRFSFDFDAGQLVTGDRIEIRRTDAGNLDFVDPSGWVTNSRQSAGTWFIHVDDVGGIKLYTNFGAALNGGTNDAVVLTSIASDIPIVVTVQTALERILGQVTEYELNTNREVVDITALSEEFRSQYATLMSGSGRITCFWDYLDTVGGGAYDTSHYLLQLVLRTQIGSEFAAQLYLKSDSSVTGGNAATLDDQIWYDIKAVITNAAVQFDTQNVVRMTADFITTGPVELKTKTIPDYDLLLSDGGRIVLNQDTGATMLLETDQ